MRPPRVTGTKLPPSWPCKPSSRVHSFASRTPTPEPRIRPCARRADGLLLVTRSPIAAPEYGAAKLKTEAQVRAGAALLADRAAGRPREVSRAVARARGVTRQFGHTTHVGHFNVSVRRTTIFKTSPEAGPNLIAIRRGMLLEAQKLVEHTLSTGAHVALLTDHHGFTRHSMRIRALHGGHLRRLRPASCAACYALDFEDGNPGFRIELKRRPIHRTNVQAC